LIGQRLRQARLAAGLSLEELASTLHRPVTKQALSKYEKGRADPTASMIMDLARVLHVRPSFLLSEPKMSVSWVGFRKHSSLTKKTQEAITATATKRLEGELRLRTLFRVGLNRALPHGLAVQDGESAEEAAWNVRETWGLGRLPLNGAIETIEDHGGIVLSWDERREFDGLSGWTNTGSPVIVTNASATSDRRRFDVAHELGHLVMAPKTDADQYESLAHRFAAAFLVPRDAALRELGEKRRSLSVQELGLLKERWGLSMQAWVRRGFDLGVIDHAEYKRLNIEFRSRGWHRAEPYAYEGIEEPILLKRLVCRALSEGIISESEARELCPEVEFEREPKEEPEQISLRELAHISRGQRDKVLSEAHLEVDPEDVRAWDAVLADGVD
jgi:Zn-dependent peptidase ImmA (M78 family)/transcriptional regulator with XRE-family HTH domain